MGFRCAVAFLVVFISTLCSVYAQSLALERFAVYFKDKNNNPYSVYNPSAFLSPRAMDRRLNQHIAVEENDLPVSPLYVNGLVGAGATLYNKSKWLNAAVVSVTDSNALQTIRSLPYVRDVKVVARYKAITSANTVPQKKAFQFHYPNQELNTDPAYGMALRQIDILNGVGLHRKGFDGRGVVIAVLDAGFTNADVHPGLQHIFTSERILNTHDFVANGSVFGNSNHGTQCFSIIGVNAPGVMIGTAPGASFVLCRTEEGGSEMPIEEYNWAAAAEYADSLGVDVISSSLGYSTFDDSTLNHTYAQLDGNTTVIAIAADMAAAKGIIVVNSAGNTGDKPWHYITTPADADSILAVGAVDENEVAGAFSANGYSADGQVKPDVMAMGIKVAIANPGNGDYNNGSGTSFAAPAIAGMTACLLQAHPLRTSQEIIQAVRMSADRYPNPDSKYGYGVPDYQLADLILANVNLDDFSTNPQPMLYPNPFRGSVTVVHYSTVREAARVELVNTLGQILYEGFYTLQPGYNQLVTDTSRLPSGLYIVRLITESAGYELKAVHQ